MSRQRMDEADAFEHRALAPRLREQHSVEIAGREVGDRVRRRIDAQLDIAVRVEAVFSEIVAQQHGMHRQFVRDAELESFPVLRIAALLVPDMQHDGISVDVLNSRHERVGPGRSDAHRHRQRQTQHKMRRIELGVDQLVAHECPTRRTRQRNRKTFLLVFAHRVGKQQRDSAGDRHIASGELRLFRLAALLRDGFGGAERQNLGERRKRRRRPDSLEEHAPLQVIRHDRAEERLLDRALGARLEAVASKPCVVLRRAASTAAGRGERWRLRHDDGSGLRPSSQPTCQRSDHLKEWMPSRLSCRSPELIRFTAVLPDVQAIRAVRTRCMVPLAPRSAICVAGAQNVQNLAAPIWILRS